MSDIAYHRQRLFKDSHGRLLSLQSTDPSGFNYLYWPRLVYGYTERTFVGGNWITNDDWKGVTTDMEWVGNFGRNDVVFPLNTRRWGVVKFSNNPDDTDPDKNSDAIDVSNRDVLLLGLSRWWGFPYMLGFIRWDLGSDNYGAFVFRWVTSQITGFPAHTWFRSNSVEFYRFDQTMNPAPSGKSRSITYDTNGTFITPFSNAAAYGRWHVPLSNFQNNTHGIFIDYEPLVPEPTDTGPLKRNWTHTRFNVQSDPLIY